MVSPQSIHRNGAFDPTTGESIVDLVRRNFPPVNYLLDGLNFSQDSSKSTTNELDTMDCIAGSSEGCIIVCYEGWYIQMPLISVGCDQMFTKRRERSHSSK
jgi:hypothetical protein